MEKSKDIETHPIEGTISHHDKAPVSREQELTLREVFKNHKIIVWWCFYWAMCAVGWYVCLSLSIECACFVQNTNPIPGASMHR